MKTWLPIATIFSSVHISSPPIILRKERFCDKQPLHHIQRHAFKMPKVKPAAASTVKKTTQYTVEMKNYAQQLHKDGLTNSQIIKKN